MWPGTSNDVPSKPALSERAKKLKAQLKAIDAKIDAVNAKMLEDPGSVRLSMELAGLNTQKWSTMGAIEQDKENLPASVKCTRQELDWAAQHARMAATLDLEETQRLISLLEADSELDVAFDRDERDMNAAAS